MERGFQKEKKGSGSEEHKQEQLIAVLRRSRKAFLVEYACGAILLILTGIAYYQGIQLPREVWYLALVVAIASLSVGEISRLFLSYKITNHKITVTKGIIKKSIKNVNYHPLAFVPDINMRQTRLQRLLNYGSVYIESGSSAFDIKDVDCPAEIMQLIEGLIQRTRESR